MPDASVGAGHGRALCEAAVTLAERAQAAAIVAVTEGGRTARLLAALRPTVRVLAATADPRVASQLALVWGVRALTIDRPDLGSIRDAIRTRALVPAGSAVVFVSMRQELGADGANFVHVERM